MTAKQLAQLRKILTEDTWSKGIQSARRADGSPTHPTDSEAVRFTLPGAVWHVSGFWIDEFVTKAIIKYVTLPDHAIRFQHLISILPKLQRPNEMFPQIFNQDRNTTWEDIEAVLADLPEIPIICHCCNQINLNV